MRPSISSHPAFSMLIFVAVGLVLLAVMNHFYWRLHPVAGVIEDRFMRALGDSSHVEAITLGHSHNLAIDFKALGVQGYHLYIPGSDLLEVELLDEQLADRLPRLRYVLVPLNLLFWLHDNEVTGNLASRGHLCNALKLMDSKACLKRWPKVYLQGMLFPVMAPDHGAAMVKAMIDRALGMGAIEYDEASPFPAGAPMMDGVKAVSEHGRMTAIREIDRARQSADRYGEILPVIEQAIQRMVARARARGVRLIFFTPPYSDSYLETYQTEAAALLQQRMGIISLLRERYDIEYYDFSRDERHIHDHSLFQDGSHMNRDGAKKFTAILRDAAKIE